MSIAYCFHCDSAYDQDYNVEHEEECKDELLTDHVLGEIEDNINMAVEEDENEAL